MFDFTTIKSQDSFYAARAKGLGASDMPVLAGYTKKYFREVNGKNVPLTPYVLWMEKTGRIKGFSGNEYTYWGNQLEAIVMREFIRRREIPKNLCFRKTEFVHPDYPYALSHPDLVFEPPGLGHEIQEIKTATFFAAKRGDDPDAGYDKEDFSSSGIPASVYVQVMWQLFTSDIKSAGVSCLMNTSTYREYGPITYNKKIIEQLLARADRFWWHVANDREPTPETWGDVQLIFPEVKPTSTMVAGEVEQKIRAIKEEKKKINKKIKELKKRKEDGQSAIGILIGENKILAASNGDELAKQTTYDKDSLSLATIKKEDPELYKQLGKYIKTTKNIRRLTW